MSREELKVYQAIKAEIKLNYDIVNVYMCISAKNQFYTSVSKYSPGVYPVLDKILGDISKLIDGYNTVSTYLSDRYENNPFDPKVANQFRLDFVNKKIEELA